MQAIIESATRWHSHAETQRKARHHRPFAKSPEGQTRRNLRRQRIAAKRMFLEV